MKAWNSWAEKWLSGEDRSEAAAAEAAARAAEAAAVWAALPLAEIAQKVLGGEYATQK
jgi:hypothetical protein